MREARKVFCISGCPKIRYKLYTTNLHENAEEEAKQSEEDVAVGKGHPDAHDALREEGRQEGGLPPEAIGQSAEDEAPHHHPAEVNGRREVLEELFVTHQVELESKK